MEARKVNNADPIDPKLENMNDPTRISMYE